MIAYEHNCSDETDLTCRGHHKDKDGKYKEKTKTSPAVPILPNGRPEDATMARDQGGIGEDSQGQQEEEHPSTWTLDFWARPIWRQLLLPNLHESQHCTSVTELCPLQRRRCLSILPSLNPMWTNHLSWVIIFLRRTPDGAFNVRPFYTRKHFLRLVSLCDWKNLWQFPWEEEKRDSSSNLFRVP